MLEVTPISLDQLDITTAQVLASYCYKDIKAIQEVSDIPDGFVIIIAPDDRLASSIQLKELLHYFFHHRLQSFIIKQLLFFLQHLFSCKNRNDIFTKVKEQATCYLALPLTFCQQKITYEEFLAQRFGQFR